MPLFLSPSLPGSHATHVDVNGAQILKASMPFNRPSFHASCEGNLRARLTGNLISMHFCFLICKVQVAVIALKLFENWRKIPAST